VLMNAAVYIVVAYYFYVNFALDIIDQPPDHGGV